MAMNIGELFGTLGLDASAWDKKLAAAQGNLQRFGTDGEATAGRAGTSIGASLVQGIGVYLGAKLADVVGGSISDAFDETVGAAMDIQAGTSKIKAQLGLTVEQAAIAGDAAGSVYAQNFGGSIEDVQVATGAVMSSIRGMRDASQADVEDMTKRMLTLSDTMEIDVARAAQVAGQMITSGIATDGVHAADLLTASLQKVPANIREDIIDAVDEYGPFMAQLGIKGEDAMGILVNASEKGMYGIDKLGDAVKEFTIRSTDMSKASGEAYEALGLDQEQMSADLLAGGDVGQAAFAKIVAGLQEMPDPVAQSAAALALFGTPLEDLSVNEIPAFLGQIDPMGDAFDSVAGASDTAMNDLANNAAAGFGGFKRQAQAAMIDFVQVNLMPSISQFASFLNNTVGPALTQVASWITNNALPALRAFGDWFSQNQGTIGLVAGIIGALLLPVFIRLAVQAAITAAAHVAAWGIMIANAVKAGAIYVAQSYKMIGSFVATAASMAVNAARVVAGWVLMGAQSLIQAARMAAAWIIAMGPIGWIITAVVGLAALIIANWDKISSFTKSIFGKVAGFLSGVWDKIVSGLKSFGEGFLDFFRELPGKLLDGLKAVGMGILKGLALGIAFGIVALKWYFFDLPVMLLSWLAAAGTWLLEKGKELLLGMKNGIVAGWEAVRTFFAELPVKLLAFLLTAGTWLLERGTALLQGLASGIAVGWEAVGTFFRELPGKVLAFLLTAGTWLLEKGTALLQGMGSGIAAGWVAVGTFFRELPGKVIAFLAAAGTWLVDAGRNTINGLRDGLVNTWVNVTSFLSELPGKIAGALSGAGTWLWETGKNIVQGLLDGIKSLAGTVGQFFLDLLPGWIVGPFKAALGIHSPSRVFYGFGENTVQGYLNAVSDGKSDISKQMAGLVEVPDTPELAVSGSYTGSAGWAGGSAAGPAASSSGPMFTAQFYITEADNADATAQVVWSRLESKLQEEGVRLGR